MKLVKYIANLGYGSRRDVAQMLEDGRVTRSDGGMLAATDAFTHDDVLVDGDPLDIAAGAILMLHKPVGYVCSTRDMSRLIYELLPARFPARSPVMAPIGRLDRDTSGLLLLTDDGQINHRITSPRTHLPKVYDAHLASDVRGHETEIFASGTLLLENESEPLQPATLEILDTRVVRLTLTEGRYHQARRMFAAVGNHVESLHRSAIGPLMLDQLPSGGWRPLTAAELLLLRDALLRKTMSTSSPKAP